MFVHLHGHSHYSLLEGYGTPKQIVEKAKSLGMPAIALTDMENLYGGIEFYKECLNNNLKPIIGVELNFIPNIKLLNSFKDNNIEFYITILAKTYQGYENIIKLISIAQIKNFYKGKAFIDLKNIEEFKKDIIIFIGGPRSWLGYQIKHNTPEKQITEILGNFINILGRENFFLEIQPQNPDILPEYKKLNHKIYTLSKNLKIKLIVNNNFFYPSKEDKEVFGVLKAINENQIFDPKEHIPKGDFHIASEDEIINMLKKYDFLNVNELIENNFNISQQINIEIPLGKILFPKYEVAPETKLIYEKYKESLIE